MANNLTLSVTLTGDGRQLSGTLRDAQNDVREFGTTTERESRKADTALTAPGRSAVTVSDHLRTTQREARAFGTEATQGGREATQALSQTSQQVQTTNSHFNLLRTTVGLALGAFSVRQLAGMTDGWSDMRSVVGAAIGDMSAAGDMMERITDIANASYAPLEQTARTYASNVSALRDLGRTAADTADYTESLNHMLVLTATRGQQAEAVQNALSRAMAVGRLQADGLETVLANGGEVAQALADQLGVTVSQLRGLASEGRITGDVIASALINSLDDVRERAGEMPATIEDGFVRIGTSATRLVGELDQAMGASEGVAGILIGAADLMNAAIDPLVDNIDNIQFAATAVAALLAGRYVGAIATSQAALAAKTAVVATTTGAINLLTGATTRQAAAATAMAGATRVAAGALALIGGPLGAAVVAGGAIYYFRDELGLTGDAAYQTTLDVDGLTSSFHLLTKAQQENRRASIVGDLIEMRLEAGRLGNELVEVSRLVRQSGQLTPEGGALPIATAEDIARGRELRHELNQLLSDIEGGTEILSQYDQIMEELGETTRKTETSTRTLADTNAVATKAADELTRATNAQATAIENLRNRLVPHRRQTLQLAQDQNTLNLAFAMGRITASEYLYLIGSLQTAYIDAQNDADDLATSTTNALYTMEGAMEELRVNGLRRLDDGFADLWLGAVDGSRSATDTIRRMWDQTLAELLHMAITRPITVQLAASMGLAGGAGGQQAGGFGISPGSVGNMWNALQGGLGGIQWGGVPTGYSGGWAGSATAGMGASGGTSFMGGSLRNFSGVQGLAGLGAGFAGNYLGGQLFGQGKHSNTLGTLGGLAGTYFGGPIGAFIGSGLGSALGGLFGGRRWNETGSGVNLGVSGGDITGNQFSDQHSSGGWFRSSKRRTQTSALDGEFASALQEVYDATEQSLAATIEVLGFQSSALVGFTTGLTRIDTKGLSAEDAEAKIQEWLGNTLNALAIRSVGDVSQYALGGETTIDTLERLAGALSTLNPILEQLHGSTLAASLAGGSAASHLADLAGGIDAFSARADYYYQNVLTETERQERAMSAAAQAIGAFTARTGQVINSTDALRDLVDGIDLTTASGRELYNEAMNLAPALVEIERGLERVGQRFDQMLQEAESALASAEQQARRAWQAFDQQQFGMQLELLALMGDAEGALALERERELASIDESLRPMRERIWAMQDEAEAQQRATQAAQGYIRELTRVRDQLSQQLGSIGNWLDKQMATSSTPQINLATAQEQFARQLVRAENGDRDALQSITQYAQQVLDANRDFNASSPAGQRIEQDVFSALKDLPKALSDAEFIVEGFRGIVTDEMAREIERAIFASQYTIDALIDFAADASALPQDLRTILGEQAHRLDSTLNYLLGEIQLDSELRQLALASSNNLVATVDYIARRQLSDGDKRLALASSNTMSAVIDYVVRSELDRENKRLALETSNAYSAMINMILGRDITADDRTLALDSANRYTTLVDYVVRAELTGGNRRLALSSLNEYQTLIDYATRADVSSDDRKLALTSGNRYLSTLDYIVGKDIDDGSKEIALASSNRYITTVNIVLGSNINSADRRLALDSTNRYDAVIRYVVDAPITGGDRRLALSAGQQYEALIGYYVNRDISQADRTLALNSANRYLANVEFIVGRDISSSDRRLALNSNNRYVSTIDQLIGKQVTGGDRRLALNSTNAYLTTVDAVLKRGIPADVRTFGLANSNAIMTTVDGILASGMSGDVRTLALTSSNRFVTTLEAALKDGRITGDERKLLDARSEDVIKTLKTSGSLNLTQDEWAVINAASGTQRLQLLADVAFGRTDLDHLKDIDDNTRSLEERALEQLTSLNGLVSEMSRTTDQFVDLNSTMISLRESINTLGVAQNEIARIEQERVAAQKAEQMRVDAGRVQSKIDEFYTLAESTGRNANDNVDRYRTYNWIDGDQGSFVDRIDGWTYQSQMAAWTARRLELAAGRENELERMRREYRSLTGELAPFANGGWTGPGGKWDPAGIVHAEEFVVRSEVVKQPGVRGMLEALNSGQAVGSTPTLRAAPLPSYPLLGNSDIVETLRDLKREVAELRRDNARLQGESNKHLAAANNQRGAAATQQIAATERGNKMLKKMEDDKRLEAAKR
ncbi:tape measure protein [Halomonas sp. NyZ770]|uniref:tape measure protein n=1 Tax=Halomonas sp. NyZ770 TaxID=2883106 RepID=UPI001D0A1293|nr:tape measure protein [Halomonas sp. NyZ770]UDM07811.1 tape measure protein [Halomonas sp. NyZ770]